MVALAEFRSRFMTGASLGRTRWSPTATIATRTRRWQTGWTQPCEASRPMMGGAIRVPAGASMSPASSRCPRAATSPRGSGPRRISITRVGPVSGSGRTWSGRTTASAPTGMGSPAWTRNASPASIESAADRLDPRSPATRSRTPALASEARTA